MSSVADLISSGIYALQSKNPGAATNAAKQLAARLSVSEDPQNVELGNALSAVAVRVEAKVGTATAPSPSPQALASLETSLKDVWAGESAGGLLLPGQATIRDPEPAAPQTPPQRKQAWENLVGLQRAALAARASAEQKVNEQGGSRRNPAANTNYVSIYKQFAAAKSKYLIDYAGEPVIRPPIDQGLNPFTPEGQSALERKRLDEQRVAVSNASVIAGLREIRKGENAEVAKLSARVKARKDAEEARPTVGSLDERVARGNEQAMARNRTAKNLGYRNSRNQQEDNDQFAELQRRILDPTTDLATLEALRDVLSTKKDRVGIRYNELEKRIAPIINQKRMDEAAASFVATKQKKQANVVARPRTQGNVINPLISKGPRNQVTPYPDLATTTADINGPAAAAAAAEPPRIFKGGPVAQPPIREATRAVAPNIVKGGYRVSRKQRSKRRTTHKG